MELWYQFPDLRKRLGWLGLLRITLLSSSSCLAPFVLVNMLTLPPRRTELESSFLFQSTFCESLLCPCPHLCHMSLPQQWALEDTSAKCPACAKFIPEPKDSKLPLRPYEVYPKAGAACPALRQWEGLLLLLWPWHVVLSWIIHWVESWGISMVSGWLESKKQPPWLLQLSKVPAEQFFS